MLADVPAWTAAMLRSGAEHRWLVVLTTAVGTTYKFTNGPCDQIAQPESVLNVSVLPRSVDPITRAPSVGQATVVLTADPLVRTLLVGRGLAGCSVAVYLGEKSLAEASFIKQFGGRCQMPTQDGKTVRIVVKTAEEVLFGYPRGFSGLNTHPLQVVRSVITSLGNDVISSGEYDADTLDPDGGDYNDISHWVVSRHSVAGAYAERAIVNPIPLAEITTPMMQMLDANLMVWEDGLLAVKRVDRSAAVATWTSEEFWDFRVVTMEHAFANRILTKTHSGYGAIKGKHVEDFQSRYQLDDTASQARYARIVGAVSYDLIREMVLPMEWVTAFGFFGGGGSPMTDVWPGVGEEFIVHYGEVYSMCGTRWPGWPVNDPTYTWPSPPAQPATAQLSDTRTAYLRIEGQGAAEDEIIEVDRCSCYYSMDIESREWMASASADSIKAARVMQEAWYRVKARGALGTVAAAHSDDCEVTDITIPVAVATAMLPRVANGLFKVSIKTRLDKFYYQIGDVIALEHADFAAFGIDGLDGNTYLEITGKSVDTSGDEVFIDWELSYTAAAAPPASTPSHQAWPQGVTGWQRQAYDAVANQDVGSTHVVGATDFDFVDDGGLNGTLENGSISTLLGRQEMVDELAILFQASKDTYIVWEPRWGGYVVLLIVANGAAAPTLADAQIFLWKIETDAGDITGTTDLRSTTAMDGGLLHDGSVAEAELGPLSVTEGKIGPLAVSEGKVAPDAITATKLAADSVGPRAVNAGIRTTSVIPNSNFGVRSLG